MRTVLIFIICYLGPMTMGHSQGSIESVIIDQITQKPIPFVNVGIVGRTKGTVSDQAGRFSLSWSDDQDSIIISAIGYRNLKLALPFSNHQGSIELLPEVMEIPLIEVNAKALHVDVIKGEQFKKRLHSIGFYGTELGAALGAKIQIERETWVKSVHFMLNHVKEDSLFFRVKIYEIVDEKIGANLLRENVILRLDQRMKIIEADLSDQNLVVNHDILLCLEWIKGKSNQGVTFNAKKVNQDRFTFVRLASLAPFTKLSHFPHGPKLKLGFYITAKTSKERND